ncbi:MAG: DHA2 family efflux MFS transporter permease subunit [Pseudomonadota bacterium]|nr:DHA2 family efflux MFS transporter permease subunit [Pseudomonadota bacterium]|tara:strand:- start:922 stop:2442 length:1521 start_codon:yes stop_codon:yes gene_type:complete
MVSISADDNAPVGLRHWLILATVQITTLTFGMTITAANVVLPQLKGAMSATPDQIAWVVTFNLVATAIATPLTGWFAQTLGWRNLLFASLTGFTVFSGLCGLANSLESLVLFRVGQGAFGAPLLPLGQGMILATFPRRLHPMALMVWGIGGVIGPVMGPILGGIIAEATDWRWVFFMIVPLGIMCLFVAAVSVGDQEKGTARKFDFTGFVALALAVGAAQLVLDRGQRLDWFESPEIIIETCIGLVSFYIFIVHSFTSENPFLNLRLFLDRNFALGCVMAFAMGWLSYTPIVLFPPLLQELRGYPDSLVGYLIAARGFGNWLSFLIVVQFTRLAPRSALAVGLASQAIAGWQMGQLSINLTEFDVFWTNLLHGFGFGLAYTPMAFLAFSTLTAKDMVEGSGIFNLLRHFGSSVFISISVAVLIETAAWNYSNMAPITSPYNELLRFPDVIGQWMSGENLNLSALSKEIFRQAQMIGYLNAFQLFGLAAALSIPLCFLFRNPKKLTN